MKVIGHRGARGLAPENTLAALQKGLDHHVDELEFDLRVTRDGVVMLHHDVYLTDPNGEKHVVSEHRFAELKAHKPDLVSFEEVLQTIDKSATLFVEVKPGELTAPIVAVIKKNIKRRGWRRHSFLLGSKSQKTLLELHAALPDIQKIVIEPWSGVWATHRARQVGTRRIAMNQRWLWWGFIRSMVHGRWKLSAYPLNDPAKAARWQKHGLYGVITDYPDRFEKR